MALKAAVRDLNAIPEASRALYKKGEGEFAHLFLLDVELAEEFGLDRVEKLRSGLSRERELKAEAETELKALKKKYEGVDPEEARAAIEAQKKGQGPDVDKQIANAVRQKEAQFEQERGQFKAQVSSLQGQLFETLVRAEGRRAIAAAGGDPELLLPHLERTATVSEIKEGEVVKLAVRLKDKDGAVRLSQKQGSGATPMELEEFVLVDLKTRFPGSFKGSGASGSGAGGSGSGNAGPGGGSGQDLSKLSPTERLKEIRRRETAGST